MLILTNGERSERDYLNGLKLQHGRAFSFVNVIFDNKAPGALVARAATLRRENFYNAAWVVCDVDEFEVSTAIAGGQREGIEIAWSNPCFEIWLIVHLRKGCPPLQSGRDAESKLKQLLPSWDKARLNFADFEPYVRVAIERAGRLGSVPDDNPSTSVGALVSFMLDRIDSGPARTAFISAEASSLEKSDAAQDEEAKPRDNAT
jgi:hypothetical protein